MEFHGAASNWSLIATQIPGRTAKQLRERWHNHLNKGVKKGAWTDNEDEIISETQKLIGNQWAKIAGLLNGRTDNDVKNRFHVIQRRKGEESASRIFRNQRKEQNQRNKRMRCGVTSVTSSKNITQGDITDNESVFTYSYSSNKDSDISASCHSTLSSDSMDSVDSMDSYESGCSLDDYVVDQEILDILASESDAHHEEVYYVNTPNNNDYDWVDNLCIEYVLN